MDALSIVSIYALFFLPVFAVVAGIEYVTRCARRARRNAAIRAARRGGIA